MVEPPANPARFSTLLDHPLLRGVPCLRKPYCSTELQQCVCELYWLDLLKGLARIDQQIAQAWSRIINEARTISRRAAEGQDTGAAERRLQTLEGRSFRVSGWSVWAG
jgi:hypothetical protein